MENKNRILINVFITFMIAIAGSFIPDNFHEFFGDYYCEFGYIYNRPTPNCIYSEDFYHPAKSWHWGVRHWLWCFMAITLFTIQMIALFFKPQK